MTDVIRLDGTAYERGRAQATLVPEGGDAVRAAVRDRIAANADLLGDRRFAAYLDEQDAYLAEHDPDGRSEYCGIADGYGIPPRHLLAFLHMAVLRDVAAGEGCSAFAYSAPGLGAVVGKNRDLTGAWQQPLQRVFRHSDPAWNGRYGLFVGSLGAPGAYSSGINSDGLALVDTQVAARDHGVGLLRYFVMTRLLARCTSVAEALAEIGRLTHAGGGNLVLADRSGAVAAVELGHARRAAVQMAKGAVARTNHFTDSDMAAAGLPGDDPDSSAARLGRLRRFLATASDEPPPLDAARRVLAGHDDAAGPGLCRHGAPTGSSTVSGAVFTTASPTLYFCHGPPCATGWLKIVVE
ncbi:MAG: C45 family peptidase [Bauldia sp.]|nr:C45 family peptidase [Bauldia sp.]